MDDADYFIDALERRILMLRAAAKGACRYGVGLPEYGADPPPHGIGEADCRRRAAALGILLDACRAAEAVRPPRQGGGR